MYNKTNYESFKPRFSNSKVNSNPQAMLPPMFQQHQELHPYYKPLNGDLQKGYRYTGFSNVLLVKTAFSHNRRDFRTVGMRTVYNTSRHHDKFPGDAALL